MRARFPKIEFGINAKLEKKIFESFAVIGMSICPELNFLLKKKFRDQRKGILSAYVDNLFQIYESSLNEDLANIDMEWKRVESVFYKETERLFKGYRLPYARYRGMISKWCVFPRYVDKKLFTFPARSQEYPTMRHAVKMVGHEMLHFIEYDYLCRVYGFDYKPDGDRASLLWKFTENMNVLIEDESWWMKTFEGKSAWVYPGCEELYSKMKRVWRTYKDVDALVDKVLLESD